MEEVKENRVEQPLSVLDRLCFILRLAFPKARAV